MEGSSVLSPGAFSHRDTLIGILPTLHCSQRHFPSLGLRGFPNSSFKVLARRALESVQVVAGALCLYSN